MLNSTPSVHQGLPFLSEYEFLASWCLGAGLGGQGKESLHAGDLTLD